jgi:quinol monooxygenase YgiN
LTVLLLERLPVAPGRSDPLRANAAASIEAMRASEGALWAEIAEVDDGLLIVSEWRRPEDLDAWEASETALALAESRDPLLASTAGRRRFTAQF